MDGQRGAASSLSPAPYPARNACSKGPKKPLFFTRFLHHRCMRAVTLRSSRPEVPHSYADRSSPAYQPRADQITATTRERPWRYTLSSHPTDKRCLQQPTSGDQSQSMVDDRIYAGCDPSSSAEKGVPTPIGRLYLCGCLRMSASGRFVTWALIRKCIAITFQANKAVRPLICGESGHQRHKVLEMGGNSKRVISNSNSSALYGPLTVADGSTKGPSRARVR